MKVPPTSTAADTTSAINRQPNEKKIPTAPLPGAAMPLNDLSVLTIQLGITVGGIYRSAALVLASPLMVPVAAALPVAVALVIRLTGKRNAYRRVTKSAAGLSH